MPLLGASPSLFLLLIARSRPSPGTKSARFSQPHSTPGVFIYIYTWSGVRRLLPRPAWIIRRGIDTSGRHPGRARLAICKERDVERGQGPGASTCQVDARSTVDGFGSFVRDMFTGVPCSINRLLAKKFITKMLESLHTVSKVHTLCSNFR